MSTTELFLDPTPLLDAARNGRPWHTDSCDACTRHLGNTRHLCVAAHELAAQLGVTTETIQRWKSGTTRVRGHHADQLAVAAGRTPYEIWPELLEVAVEQVEWRTCERDGCDRTFHPRRRGQRFCRPRCREAAEIARRHPPRPPVTCPGCGTTFTLTPAQRRRYCTPACQKAAAAERTRARDAERKRLKYQTDPHHRVTKLAAAREYKAATRKAATRRLNQGQEVA